MSFSLCDFACVIACSKVAMLNEPSSFLLAKFFDYNYIASSV